VLYFVAEMAGQATHPLTDMFFHMKNGEFVLVDVTGAREGQTGWGEGRHAQSVD